MIHTQYGRSTYVLAALMTLIASASTSAQDYVLRAIVAPGDVIDGTTIIRIESSVPAVSANGEVAFVATVLDGVDTKRGIFTQNRIVALEGENIDGFDMLGFSTGPGSMNAQGDLAFAGVFDAPGNTLGIYFAPGPATTGTTTMVARSGMVVGGETLTSVGWPSMDDAGNIVFTGFVNDLSSPFFGHGIYTPTHPLVRRGDVIDGVVMDARDYDARLSSSGELRFVRLIDTPTDPPLRHGVFTETALLRQGTDSVSGKTLDPLLSVLSVSASGVPVFQAEFTDDTTGEPGEGYFTPDELLVATGTVIDGTEVTGFRNLPATLLESGQLYFVAQIDGTFDRGLFNLDRAVARPSILVEMPSGVSMPLRTVQQVAVAHEGLIRFIGFIDGPQEVLIEAVPADGDGDGVPDDVDECLESDTDETVVIGGCDSGVSNFVGANGCSVNDDVSACVESSSTRRGFRSCVADLARELRQEELFRRGDAFRVWLCAVRSRLP